NVLFLDHLDVGHAADDARGLGVGLVVTEVIARANVDEADHQRLVRCAGKAEWHGCSDADQTNQFEKLTTIKIRHGHVPVEYVFMCSIMYTFSKAGCVPGFRR